MRVVVFQREPGESKPWYVRYTQDGRRVWKSIGTRSEAEEYAARLRARLLYGEDAEPVASVTALIDKHELSVSPGNEWSWIAKRWNSSWWLATVEKRQM